MKLIIIVVLVMLPVIINTITSKVYKKYRNIIYNNIKGIDIVDKIFNKNNIDIKVSIKNNYYDIYNKILYLDNLEYNGNTIISLALSAYYASYAIQDKLNYNKLRNKLRVLPLLNFLGKISYIVMLIALIIKNSNIFYIGVLMILIDIVYNLITIDVEKNAQDRAINSLHEIGLNDKDDILKDIYRITKYYHIKNLLSITNMIIDKIIKMIDKQG